MRVVITGGTAGLGLACAKACRAAGHEVVVAARREGGLDLASLASVRDFAERVDSLDALVCNAGIQLVSGSTLTEDGFETTFAVNHLAHFALATWLLPKIRAGGRIVFVASDTHDPREFTPGMPKPRFVDPRALAIGGGIEGRDVGEAGRLRYTTSKLLNVMCAYEMSRRVPRGVAVNAFDPGFMPGTELARDYGPIPRFFFRRVLPVLAWIVPNVNRVEVSGARLAELAAGASFEGVTGKYVSRGRVYRSSVESYDRAKANELWEASMELLKEARR